MERKVAICFGVLLLGILFASGFTMWLFREEYVHPDAVLVINAIDRFVGKSEVIVHEYSGRGAGSDSAWWAKAEIKSRDLNDVKKGLKHYVANHSSWKYLDNVSESNHFSATRSLSPPWWNGKVQFQCIELMHSSAGFCIGQNPTVEHEWFIMWYGR